VTIIIQTKSSGINKVKNELISNQRKKVKFMSNKTDSNRITQIICNAM